MNSGRGKIVSGLLGLILGGNLRGKGARWAMGELCIAFSDLVETLTSGHETIRPPFLFGEILSDLTPGPVS